MSFEKRIIAVQDHLNFNEKQALDWIYQHKEQLLGKTITNIASDVHMSKSFVSKLIKKVGYSSFAEFKVKLEEEMVPPVSQKTSHLIDVQQGDLSETKRLLRQTNFKGIFQMLDDSEFIYCYGTGHTQQNYMRELSRNLMSIGSKRVIYLSGKSELESIVSTATSNNCLIISSNSGETNSTIEIVEKLVLRRVSILSITAFSSSRLVRLSDYNLFYLSTPIVNPLNKNSLFSFLPLNLCIDTLIRKYLEHLSTS